MARPVVCAITGERGDTDAFVKIGKRYYKSQETYDKQQRLNELRKKIISTICDDFLGYQKGQPFPTTLTKYIKDLEFYGNEIILKTVEDQWENIKYWMNNKNFESDAGRLSYIFAIIKNKINDVYKDAKREEKRQERPAVIQEEDASVAINRPVVKAKDITAWLEDDD